MDTNREVERGPGRRGAGTGCRLFVLALALPLSCALSCRTPTRTYTDLPLEPPAEWASEGAGDLSELPTGDPWLALGGPELAGLVQEAVGASHDLAASVARIEAAEARARFAHGARLPSAQVGLDSSRARQNFVGLPVPGGSGVLSSSSTSFGLTFGIAWEIDLWGRLAAGELASVADLQASRAEAEALRLSIAGDVARSFFGWIEAVRQAEIARATVASYARSTAIVRARYENGRSDAFDLRLLEGERQGAEALVAVRDEAREREQRRLEILLGRVPTGELGDDRAQVIDLPPVPPPVPACLPSDLLRRRPDLIAAERRLAALDYRLFEARTELYPQFDLTLSGGRRTTELEDLFDADFDVWSWALGLVQPLFQGGRLRAGIDLADAVAREALELYASDLLRAFGEVEILLAVEEHLVRREAALLRAVHESRAAQALVDGRYRAGRASIVDVLTAQRSVIAGESAALEARRAHLMNRVDLFLALGGDFPERMDTAPELEEQR